MLQTKNISSRFRCLARDIPGAEGPLVTRDNEIFMVAPGRGEVVRVSSAGEVTPWVNTGGKPAGLQLHRDGSIWVADMSRGVLRIDANGKIEEIASEYEGAPIRGCNDLSFDSVGNLYVTAPGGSKADCPVGEIFFISKDRVVRRIAQGFAFPNGIAVAPGDKKVIFAETFTFRLISLELSSPGEVSELRDFAMLPHVEEKAGGDGMDFDASGRLVATNYSRGTLEIYSAEGSHLESVPLPFKRCSNVHFFNDDSGCMLITEHENMALWLFEYGIGGMQQFGWK